MIFLSQNNRVASLRKLLFLLAILGLATTRVLADANEAGMYAAGVETLTVTAERIEQDSSKTSVSLVVLDSDDIANLGIDNVYDLQFAVPGLVFGGYNNTSNTTLRGVGSNVQFFNDPGVGVYVDGVYQASSFLSWQDYPDVERIEVLRGPQSTLYGYNNVGGAIKLFTRVPSADSYSNFNMTLGNFDRYKLNGTLGGGGEFVAGRISFDLEDRSAYSEASNGRGLDDGSSQQINYALVVNGRKGVQSVTIRGGFADQEKPQVLSLRAVEQDIFGLEPTTRHRGLINQNLDHLPERSIKHWGVSLTWEAGFDRDSKMTWITSVQSDSMKNSGDSDGSVSQGITLAGVSALKQGDLDYYENGLDLTGEALAMAQARAEAGFGDPNFYNSSTFNPLVHLQELVTNPLANGLAGIVWLSENDPTGQAPKVGFDLWLDQGENEVDQFSQEITFSGNVDDGQLRYAAGIYYLKRDLLQEDNYYLVVGGDDAVALSPTGLSAFRNGYRLDADLEHTSAFGQGTWMVTPRFAVTLGARFARDTHKGEHDRYFRSDDDQCGGNNIAEKSWSNNSSVFGWHVDVSDRTYVYHRISEAHKSGGFNLANCNQFYEPETVRSNELGAKLKLMQERLRLNFALYELDYESYQTGVFESLTYNVYNAVNAKSDGAEFDISYVANGISLAYRLAYTDSRVSDVLDDAVTIDIISGESIKILGNQLPRSPKRVHSASLGYAWTAGASMQGRLALRYNDSSEYYFNIDNSEFDKQPSYSTIDANVVFSPSGNDSDLQWSFGFFIRNLRDKAIIVSSGRNDTVKGTIVAYGEPRTSGIRFGREW